MNAVVADVGFVAAAAADVVGRVDRPYSAKIDRQTNRNYWSTSSKKAIEMPALAAAAAAVGLGVGVVVAVGNDVIADECNRHSNLLR